MKRHYSLLSFRTNDKGFNLFFPLLAFFLFAGLFLSPFQEGHCAQLTLTWDPNSEPDLAGYKIYYGTTSGNYPGNLDVGNVTTCALTGLNWGTTYYAAATAYNTTGYESGFSNEVSFYTGSCSYTISPSSASFSNAGGSGSVVITTQAGCNWGTSASIPWITVTSGSGMGSGTMSYTVSSNSGANRSASMTIAGNVFTVTEAGLPSYIITASAEAGGTISPTGQVSILSGTGQTFTITPNTDYQIANVTVDGVSQGAITSYTFSSVGANHSIIATFSMIIKTPVVTTGSVGAVTLNSATLNGTVNPNGLSTTYVFEWGTTTSYGNITAIQSAGSDSNLVAATANLTGLTENTLYHYRLVATNNAGTTHGVDATFSAQLREKVDFNNDGKTDILWIHKPTGTIAEWYMNGTNITSYAAVATFPDLNWEIVGTGDFNNDGKADILCRHKISGQIVAWYMGGGTPIGSAVVADFPDLNWEIVGTGDFNYDGMTDILWRHKQTGTIGFWYMNGSTKIRYAKLVDFPYLDWEIAGTGDFNNDGKTDILWRHKQSGTIAVWYMNGATITSYALVAEFPYLDWKIAGMGDFNKDGKTDILWRHKQSGTIAVWYMNGATITSYALVANFPYLDWEIVAPK
jgi:hypothetical protein